MRSSLFPLYVTIYNNENLKITPDQMKELFTQERFKFETIKQYLHRWDYRIQMMFESKQHRTVAIDEIKRIKSQFNVVYRYQFSKTPKMSQYLMNNKQYIRLSNLAATERLESKQSKANDEMIPQMSEVDELKTVLENKKLLKQVLQYELKLTNQKLNCH